jgi:hypothetical protein
MFQFNVPAKIYHLYRIAITFKSFTYFTSIHIIDFIVNYENFLILRVEMYILGGSLTALLNRKLF